MSDDLRGKVKDSRGLLKKIELVIPGFKGYRKREDLRIADSLLRKQIADRISRTEKQLEHCRQILVKKMEMGSLKDVAEIINYVQMVENKIRHAEQGYTGASSDYRITETELNGLYKWDLSLIEKITEIDKLVSSFQDNVSAGDYNKISNSINEIHSNLQNFDSMFEKRIETISGLVMK
jgi:hypothetical protein